MRAAGAPRPPSAAASRPALGATMSAAPTRPAALMAGAASNAATTRAGRVLQLFAIAAALAACSEPDAAADEAAVAGGDAASAGSRRAGDVTSTFQLAVTGGTHAGRGEGDL